MPRQTSIGTCYLCQGKFSKVAMARHLAKCRQEKTKATGTPKKILHLQVAGVPWANYWMHLEMPAHAKLIEVDEFLRQTWLECCGHLSAFTIEGRRYAIHPVDDFMMDSDFHEETMNRTLDSVLKPGMTFKHEYDYGTTTELALKVVAERQGTAKGNSITLLARNDPPDYKCENCKQKLATQVCSVCMYYKAAWYCDDCYEKHACYKKGEDYFLPVVNSPRVGQCGYTGTPY